MIDSRVKEKTLVRIRTLGLLFLCSFALRAADDPFVGTWKLNPAKSKFSPGPGLQSATLVIEAGGKVSMNEVDPQGQAMSWSYTATPGAAAPLTGPPDSSVMETRKGNTVKHEWKFGKAAYKGHGVVSKDGKTITYTIEGTDADGKKVKNTEIYEKQ
jgi:hypothetical protein